MEEELGRELERLRVRVSELSRRIGRVPLRASRAIMSEPARTAATTVRARLTHSVRRKISRAIRAYWDTERVPRWPGAPFQTPFQ